MPSFGSAKRLTTEKSVLTKLGPFTGVRLALPSWPGVEVAKEHGLNQCCNVRTCAGHPAPPPPLFGLPTSSGRIRLLPFCWKFTPELKLALSTTKTGKPDVMCSINVSCQPPRIVLTGL